MGPCFYLRPPLPPCLSVWRRGDRLLRALSLPLRAKPAAPDPLPPPRILAHVLRQGDLVRRLAPDHVQRAGVQGVQRARITNLPRLHTPLRAPSRLHPVSLRADSLTRRGSGQHVYFHAPLDLPGGWVRPGREGGFLRGLLFLPSFNFFFFFRSLSSTEAPPLSNSSSTRTVSLPSSELRWSL